MSPRFVAIEHVQVAIPPGSEDVARAFYRDVLGFTEVPKPGSHAARGGAWFLQGPIKLHLGVDAFFHAARKAHPAFVVEGLAELLARCRAAGATALAAEPLEGYRRAHVFDPFGNRLELMEREAG